VKGNREVGSIVVYDYYWAKAYAKNVYEDIVSMKLPIAIVTKYSEEFGTYEIFYLNRDWGYGTVTPKQIATIVEGYKNEPCSEDVQAPW
jgi:hypothetical protein